VYILTDFLHLTITVAFKEITGGEHLLDLPDGTNMNPAFHQKWGPISITPGVSLKKSENKSPPDYCHGFQHNFLGGKTLE